LPVRILTIPTAYKAYRVAQIEIDASEELYNLAVHYRYRNVRLSKYYGTISLFFFTTTLANAIYYIKKLRKDP